MVLPYPVFPGPLEAVLALLASVALDMVYPRHKGLAYLLHPVRLAYLLARRLAPPYSGTLRGVITWLTVMAAFLIPTWFTLSLLSIASSIAWAVTSVLVLKVSLSLRLLIDTCREVSIHLLRGDLSRARRTVGEIVRRDTTSLSESLVASAAIESLAENIVDGFVSPILYYPVLGPLGSLAQRIANTLDAALGYKTPEYLRAGKLSAHADTALNYIPSRVASAIIVVAAPLVGGSSRGALDSWRRWGRSTESLNAGPVMSAMAGALGVRLEKPGHYVINPGGRDPGPHDIMRATKLAWATALLTLLAVIAVTAAATHKPI